MIPHGAEQGTATVPASRNDMTWTLCPIRCDRFSADGIASYKLGRPNLLSEKDPIGQDGADRGVVGGWGETTPGGSGKFEAEQTRRVKIRMGGGEAGGSL